MLSWISKFTAFFRLHFALVFYARAPLPSCKQAEEGRGEKNRSEKSHGAKNIIMV